MDSQEILRIYFSLMLQGDNDDSSATKINATKSIKNEDMDISPLVLVSYLTPSYLSAKLFNTKGDKLIHASTYL